MGRVAQADDGQVFDLAYPLVAGMPQSPRHPAYSHSMVRRHGDQIRADGTSSANDLIVMGTHVGTHIDALGHYSADGKLHGGASAESEQRGGSLSSGGAECVPIFFHRGVLLDIPNTMGREYCPDDYEISPTDLASAARELSRPIEHGDVVLIGTGWGRRYEEGAQAFLGWQSGVPGVGAAGAEWLADKGVAAVGGETIAFEHVKPGKGHALLPAHKILLVERGIYIFETMDLSSLRQAGAREFRFVAAPLKLQGASGAPVRPFALVE